MESWFLNENSGNLVHISCEEYAMFRGFVEDMLAYWLKLVRGFRVFGVFLDVSSACDVFLGASNLRNLQAPCLLVSFFFF